MLRTLLQLQLWRRQQNVLLQPLLLSQHRADPLILFLNTDRVVLSLLLLGTVKLLDKPISSGLYYRCSIQVSDSTAHGSENLKYDILTLNYGSRFVLT